MSAAAESLERRLLAGGLVGDPFYDGSPRFREAPVVISEAAYAEMGRVAARLVEVHDEAARLVAEDDELLDSFFDLSPCQKLMWQASAPFWHGYARADIFETRTGFVACELNSDTPTGHAETLALSEVSRASHEGPEGHLFCPNRELSRRTLDMICGYAESRLGRDHPRTAGIVYPTDLTEDLPLVRLLDGWLASRGYRTVTGSPYNVSQAADGRVALFDEPCSVLLRHYKTDWWGERVPVWKGDPPFDDPFPLARALEVCARAELAGKSVVVNPFGAVLTQNKRMLAFLWENQDDLSEESSAFVRAHLPETLRLESVHPAMLSVERTSWVLKSDYGCEGDEVVCGWDLTQDEWDRAIALALPGRWVAQRRFEPVTDASGESVNYGVYVVAGEPAGLYTRVQTGSTDRGARSAPAFVRRSP